MKTKLILLAAIFASLVQSPKAIAQISGNINKIAADHTGKYFVTAGENGKVNIWDLDSQIIHKEIWMYGGSSIEAISISPDNKFIAIAASYKGTSIFTFPEGKIVAKLKDAGSLNLIYLPNGNLVTVNYEGETQVWDVSTKKMVREIKPGKAIYCPLGVSPDGKFLLTAAPKHRFKLWDLTSDSKDELFKGNPETAAKDFAFSSDSKLFAVAGDVGENAITIYNTETRAVVRLIPSTSNDNEVIFSADNKSVFVSSYDQVSVVNIETGEKEELKAVKHFKEITGLTLNADGTMLMTGGKDIQVIGYDLTKKYLKLRLLHIALEPKPLEHPVGEHFGGGMVVDSYRTGDGQEHGLIMSREDLADATWSGQQLITEATSSDGEGNTDAMLRSGGLPMDAAGVCRAYRGGDFTDWYLPSVDECTRATAKIGFLGKWKRPLWTSTEFSESEANCFNFSNGEYKPAKKVERGLVRAVRKF